MMRLSTLLVRPRITFPSCPQEILRAQRLLTIQYHSFDGRCHEGRLMVHELIADDVRDIFRELLYMDFPITKMIPLSDPYYDWNDEHSMNDDNTSGFNYRTIAGTDRLSLHGYGLAIDINPRRNPCIRGQEVSPRGARYDPTVYGTIIHGSPVVEVFLDHGFVWGGHWEEIKDYQHFEKPVDIPQSMIRLVKPEKE